MKTNEIKRFATLHFWFGFILLAMIFWDHYGLKATDWKYFYPYKFFYIFAYWGLAYVIKKKKISLLLSLDLSIITSYTFCFFSVKYLHPTYFFTFYECYLFFSFLYTGPIWRYVLHMLLAVGLTLLSVLMIPEPEFVKEGYSFKDNFYAITLIMALVSAIIYLYFNRQREIYYSRQQQFISVGQQAAFLLHEIKSPLNRFILRHADKDPQDAESILSIVQSIEMLMKHQQAIVKKNFPWERIKNYLQQEFTETCSECGIQLNFIGFEGTAHGHEATIQMALRNLIKNAIEAILETNETGVIEVSQIDQILIVKNNGRIMGQDTISKMFTPFFTEKSTHENFGLGLPFVKTVVEAHGGSANVITAQGWNIFTLQLGKKS